MKKKVAIKIFEQDGKKYYSYIDPSNGKILSRNEANERMISHRQEHMPKLDGIALKVWWTSYGHFIIMKNKPKKPKVKPKSDREKVLALAEKVGLGKILSL